MSTKNNLFNEFNPSYLTDWKKQIEKDLKGAPLESLNWLNHEGIETTPYYTKENSFEYNSNVPSEKTDNSWKINQLINVETEELANKIALKALSGGVDSLTFVGNNLNLTQLLNNIMIDIIELNFVTNSPQELLQNINSYCSEKNINKNCLNISISFNYLNKKEIELNEVITQNNSFKNIVISSQKTQLAGAKITQQLAVLLAEGNEYLKKLHTTSGIENQFQFNLSIGNNYFFEIAKIRAFRLLWSNVLAGYKITNSSTYINCETSTLLWSKTDNENNILRASSAAMSAVIGGCDSLTITPYNFKNEDISNRITKNIQLLLKEESYLDKVVDPAKGSYYMENLTNTIAQNSWNFFQEIEKKGGYLKAIESDFILTSINQSAEELITEFKDGKIILIGVNKYVKEQIKVSLLKEPKTNDFPFGKIVLTES